MSVIYGWHDGRGWSAPDRPRYSFGIRPYLFKLQVTERLPNGDVDNTVSCREFLDEFLPILQKQLGELDLA